MGHVDLNTTDLTSAPWINDAIKEALDIARKRRDSLRSTRDYKKYINDPIRFCRDMFGEEYSDDVVKLAESVRDNVVTIARSSNGVGKTHIAARLALWFFSVYPQSQIYLAAAPPMQNLERLLWGELTRAMEKRPSLVSDCRIRKGSKLMVERNAENFIVGVSIPTTGTEDQREARFSGKHSPQLMFIVDEGDAVPEEVYKGIDSCMTGGDIVRLLVLFNPRIKAGPVYLKESTGLGNVVHLSAMRHPNVVLGTSVMPGAVTRETVIRRVHMWTRSLNQGERDDIDVFVVPEFLAGQVVRSLDGKELPKLEAGEIRKIVEPQFSYMVLGEYPSHGSSQLISEEWIEIARMRWDKYVSEHGEVPPLGVKPILGLDLAEYGGDYNVLCARYGSFVPRFKVWAGVDVDRSTDIALDHYINTKADIIMIDGTGIGSGVAPSIARRGRSHDVRAVSVKMAERPSPLIKCELGEFQMLKDQMYWTLREWLRNNENAMLPPEPMLIEELRAISYEVTSHGKIRITNKDQMRERLRRSPDRADALALTFAPFERAKFSLIEMIMG